MDQSVFRRRFPRRRYLQDRDNRYVRRARAWCWDGPAFKFLTKPNFWASPDQYGGKEPPRTGPNAALSSESTARPSSVCRGSAHMRRRGRRADDLEILGWGLSVESIMGPVVGEAVSEGIDEGLELVDAGGQVVTGIELVTP